MHLDGINRLDTAEGKISELEDITTDTIKNKSESEEKKRTRNQGAMG